jgi:hypothetical protein
MEKRRGNRKGGQSKKKGNRKNLQRKQETGIGNSTKKL